MTDHSCHCSASTEGSSLAPNQRLWRMSDPALGSVVVVTFGAAQGIQEGSAGAVLTWRPVSCAGIALGSRTATST